MAQRDVPRYRMTRAAFDVVSVFGCLGAKELPGPVFTTALAHRGYSAVSVRNQLVRMVDRGLLLRSSAGRISIYQRAPELSRDFSRYSGLRHQPEFFGSFPALLVSIPETKRTDRDRVLYLARFCGYRALRPGVLITVRDQTAELRSKLGRVLPDGRGVDFCRLHPETSDQARLWAERAFGGRAEYPVVEELGTRVRAAWSAPGLSHTEYFDLFHAVAMAVDTTELLPATLRLEGDDAALLARELLASLVSLWGDRLFDSLLAEVLGVHGPVSHHIVWDPEFWRRAGRKSPAR